MPRGTSVRHPLAGLTRDFHRIGPLSGSLDPWIGAELDQHAADVCHGIVSSGSELNADTLGTYLHGFIDGCLERGWDSAAVDYDWETLRILAICRLAKDRGFVR
ncbi:hypothetical protein DFP74_1039 [Nocardiopsis sp. Huas11]|uniref:DUF6401 family natural product biosynthesis protein n=1 Tax=unclassified Nocardiopsis TaxID=2649073 RepID=UPI0006AE0480|nr:MULTISPECIES: DUF6401 family natural product biosynthesis protein [unclassified Nocardiopsis]KOX12098.1 hypothetical protein ADL05_22165 [Nocardiopsis sp. NRRL B-16309]RKS05441.1 hypothetical protein DFP74_1039 [Nocardiopsis sp. Huas11]